VFARSRHPDRRRPGSVYGAKIDSRSLNLSSNISHIRLKGDHIEFDGLPISLQAAADRNRLHRGALDMPKFFRLA